MRKLLLIAAIAAVAAAGCKKDKKINDIDFVAVTGITGVTTVAEVGKPLTLAATVSPPDATNQTIAWSVKSAGTTGAGISGATLNAAAAGTVTVTATIEKGAATTTPFTADFNITVKNPADMPVVTGVTVVPASVSVAKGGSKQFTATVSGTKLEEADKAVNWTVTGGAKAGTVIAADGTLTVAADETATSLTVKATSAIDNTKSGTASVMIEELPFPDYIGTWRFTANDGSWSQIIISADKVVYMDDRGYNFTMNELTWTATVNQGGDFTAYYSNGYKITGKLTATNGYSIPSANGSGNVAVGDIALVTFYIGAGKNYIAMGNWQSVEQEAAYTPYLFKQDAEYWQVTWNLDGGSWHSNPNHAMQVAKDGKLAAPKEPTKSGVYFSGWYREASLTNRISFPYDVSAVTGNFTLYAKWVNTPPSATVSITTSGAGSYSGIVIQRQTETGGWAHAYSVTAPVGSGTSNVTVSPGTYRVAYNYTFGTSFSSGVSWTFTIYAEQTIRFTLSNGSISLPSLQ